MKNILEADKKKDTAAAALLTLIGGVLRLLYILGTTVYERGHDVGNYTDLTDTLVNPGHLGYIEYLAKFRHLPDFDPFSVFSYYHPPLHHFLASLVVRASALFGASTDTAFENVQFLILFYSLITLILGYLILREFGSGPELLIPYGLFCIHPSMILMSGSVNNDMLTVLFELLILYLTLEWMKDRSRKKLLLLSLAFGLGMLTKISVVVLAFPVGLVMLGYLVTLLRKKDRNMTAGCIRDYVFFGLIAGIIGLSWTVRNAVRFRVKPGIASATPESFLYMGNTPLLKRLGIPSSLGLDYPFHSVYGNASDNVWLILFRTAVFGEIRPDVTGASLFACQAVFMLNLILGLFCAVLTVLYSIREIRKGDRDRGIFLLSGYASFLFTYILFVMKYPYTCSCDFRYIVPTLLYGCIALTGTCSLIRAEKR